MVERSSGRKSCGQGRENIMIRISQLKLPVDHTPDALEKKICQQLKIKKDKKRRAFFLEDCTPIPGCTEKAGFEICLCG